MGRQKFIKMVSLISVTLRLLIPCSASSSVAARAAASLQSSSGAAVPSSIECFQFALAHRVDLYLHGYHQVLTPEDVLKTLQEHPALCGWLIAASR